MVDRIIHGSKMDYLDDYGLIPDFFYFASAYQNIDIKKPAACAAG